MSIARTIKKYPNRRLYDTEESRYITLADIRDLVLRNIAFVVLDKKTGSDITRPILLQVINDQEQNGDPILSKEFLAQVICSYESPASDRLAQHLEKIVRQFNSGTENQAGSELMSPFSAQAKNTLTSGR